MKTIRSLTIPHRENYLCTRIDLETDGESLFLNTIDIDKGGKLINSHTDTHPRTLGELIGEFKEAKS